MIVSRGPCGLVLLRWRRLLLPLCGMIFGAAPQLCPSLTAAWALYWTYGRPPAQWNRAARQGQAGARRKLRQPSKLIEVVLPRPLGIIFEENAARQQVVVGGFVPGSHAAQLAKVRA